MVKKVLEFVYRNSLQPIIHRDNVPKVRRNVNKFLAYCLSELPLTGPVLDIGPKENSYSKKLFKQRYDYLTLDIDSSSKPSIVADICEMPQVESDKFGTILCTEVLEHTRHPFKAVSELHRILKRDGYCLVTTPFNLRIHGPSPDCWRFTEDGLKELFQDKFKIVELNALRPLIRRGMPIHYTTILQKL